MPKGWTPLISYYVLLYIYELFETATTKTENESNTPHRHPLFSLSINILAGPTGLSMLQIDAFSRTSVEFSAGRVRLSHLQANKLPGTRSYRTAFGSSNNVKGWEMRLFPDPQVAGSVPAGA